MGWLSPLNHATYHMHNFGYDLLPRLWQTEAVFAALILLLFFSRCARSGPTTSISRGWMNETQVCMGAALPCRRAAARLPADAGGGDRRAAGEAADAPAGPVLAELLPLPERVDRPEQTLGGAAVTIAAQVIQPNAQACPVVEVRQTTFSRSDSGS